MNQDHLIGDTMPLWTNANSELLILHPAIGQEWAAENLALPEAEYSAEFARFLNRTGLGYLPQPDPSDRRSFFIANRKSAYGASLVSELGYLTPIGQEYYQDIKRIYQLLTLHMQETGEKLPNPADTENLENITQMDRIILKGKLTPRSLKYLRIIANLNTPTDPLQPSQPIFDEAIAENVIRHAGERVLLTAYLRVRPNERLGLEQLIKFGLVDLLKLPKPTENRNRGRNPIAAKITPIGAKFYALWEDKFNPLVQQERSWQQEFADENPQLSLSPAPTTTLTQPPKITEPPTQPKIN
jgi:hypothetical protein